jgi:hypothetical protein
LSILFQFFPRLCLSRPPHTQSPTFLPDS